MTDRERDPAGAFGALLKARLDELRWSGRELARRGVNQQTVRNMLSGRKPRIDNVIKVAAAFDDPVNPWLKAAGYPEWDPKVEEELLLERISRGAELLTSVEKRVLARMVEGILVNRGYVAPQGGDGEGHGYVRRREDHSFGEPAAAPTATGPAEIADDPVPDREEEPNSGGSG